MSKIYYNGDIMTMEAENAYAEAILVKDGLIEKVGTLDEVKCEDAEYIDLKGATLMPSFIDPHGHVSMVAQMSYAANLSECETFEDIIFEIKKHIKKHKLNENSFVLAFGYDHNFLPDGKHPTKEILDKASFDVPILALHTSGHMGCANSKMLLIAGINDKSVDPQGGVIGRVGDTKEPSGYLEENAVMANFGVLGEKLKIDMTDATIKAQMEYLKNGVTTVQDGASSPEVLMGLKKVADLGKLDIDVIAYPMAGKDTKELFEQYSMCANHYYNRFKLGGYKVVLDGSPQGKSAWLSKPYENSGDYAGYPWFKDEQVEEFMQLAIDNNEQVLVHCNGDAAGDQFLSAYVKAYHNSSNSNKANLRPVMIHCQTARDDQLDIMKEYAMIPSIFVGHVYYWGDIHIKNLGKERGENVSPCKSAMDRDLVINFHQDPPITKPKPLHSVWAAVNRLTRGGIVCGEHQKIDVFNALKAITINAAYSYFEEDIKGTITKGKLADLVILDKNPMKVASMNIKDIKVLETIKEGKTLFTDK